MDNERSLIDKLRARDESAFTEVVQRYYGYLFPLANFYVSDRAVAQEIVQEAWLAVLKGIDRFEERSSFKTWISRIVMNLARTRGVREGRMVAFSEFVDEEADRSEGVIVPLPPTASLHLACRLPPGEETWCVTAYIFRHAIDKHAAFRPVTEVTRAERENQQQQRRSRVYPKACSGQVLDWCIVSR